MRLTEVEAFQDCPFMKDFSTAYIFWSQMDAGLVEACDREKKTYPLKYEESWLACVGSHFPSQFLFYLNNSTHCKWTSFFWVTRKHILLPVNSPQ